MRTKQIYVYGGGGHGKVVVETIEKQYSSEQISGFFDDDPQKKGSYFHGYQVLGNIYEFDGLIPNLIIAIGNNEIRKKKAIELKNLIHSFITIIDPSSQISRSAKIGSGTLLMPEVIINADVQIGNHCIINSNAVVEHDCSIGDFTHIAPGSTLTGSVKIGNSTMIGACSVIVPGVTVGNNCLISAGSVVTKDIPDNAVVRGNPARILKTRKII